MEPLFLVLAVFFLLAVSFFAIGIYFSTRSKQKNALRRDKPASISIDESLREAGIQEVARMLRDGQSGALLLEKNGVVYRTADDLSEEQRRLLSVAAGDLHTFLGLSAPAVKTVEPVPPPVTATKRTSTAPLPSNFRATGQTKAPSMNPVDMFARAIASDVPNVSVITKSITAQIDDILQERLVNTPLEMRGIRLLEAPDGRVVVFVGIENYDGVEAVPDDEVRHAIRSAVTEWEKRSSLGI